MSEKLVFNLRIPIKTLGELRLTLRLGMRLTAIPADPAVE